jgi:hypothetical protein
MASFVVVTFTVACLFDKGALQKHPSWLSRYVKSVCLMGQDSDLTALDVGLAQICTKACAVTLVRRAALTSSTPLSLTYKNIAR